MTSNPFSSLTRTPELPPRHRIPEAPAGCRPLWDRSAREHWGYLKASHEIAVYRAESMRVQAACECLGVSPYNHPLYRSSLAAAYKFFVEDSPSIATALVGVAAGVRDSD